MVQRTMIYRVAARVHIAYHTDKNPSDDEWRAYKEDLGKHLADYDGLYSWTAGGGPTSKQRAMSVEFWARQQKKVPIAVVTPSSIVVGMTTALRWFMKGQIQGFSPNDVEAAFDYLHLDAAQRSTVRDVVAALRTELTPPLAPIARAANSKH
jgi:hypothetical protein